MKKPSKLRLFFSPSPTAPFLVWFAPYLTLSVIGIIAFLAASAGWSYTNSTQFCGTTCHTMPPQYDTFLRSSHSRVTCAECHLGRDDLSVLLPRKIEHSSTLYAMIFKTYEYPIVAEKMRPANEACETCHYPSQFKTDSLRDVRYHANDELNTPLSTFLLLRTGGGTRREGLGRGIHWHIENEVSFYATDQLEQEIPYVRVEYDDGTVKEFIDVDSGLTPADAAGKELHKVDCITCHNRISHDISSPEELVDSALYTGQLSRELPYLRQKAVELLSGNFASEADAFTAFESLSGFYAQNYADVYAERADQVRKAVDFLKSTFKQTHFPDQKLMWNTHPNNTGHSEAPGCFRCHDGKHLAAGGEAIRLECNLCHSIPQTADPSRFVTTVSVVRAAEPGSHTHTLWIALHGQAVDSTCARCHPGNDPSVDWTQLNGQKPPSDGSFCGNPACHQPVWEFTGFDSPGMQPILQQQLLQAKEMNGAP